MSHATTGNTMTTLPARDWHIGHVFGGSDVSLSARNRFARSGIARWYTQSRINHLVIPFLRRGGAGGAGAMDGRACISLRNLQEFLSNVAKRWCLQYSIITQRECNYCDDSDRGVPSDTPACSSEPCPVFEYRRIVGEIYYKSLMKKYHRSNMDTVRRGARSFVTGPDGTVYPTTLSQLTLLYETWRSGMLYYCVLRRHDIEADIKARHRRHTRKKPSVSQRCRWESPHQTALTIIPAASVLPPPIFVDVGQFDMLVNPPDKDESMRILAESTPDWYTDVSFVPGKSLMTPEQAASASAMIRQAAVRALEARRAHMRKPSAASILRAYRSSKSAVAVSSTSRRNVRRGTKRRRAAATVNVAPSATLKNSRAHFDSATFHLPHEEDPNPTHDARKNAAACANYGSDSDSDTL